MFIWMAATVILWSKSTISSSMGFLFQMEFVWCIALARLLACCWPNKSGSLASCAGGKQGMIFFPRGHSPGGMTSCENYELLRCTPGTRRCPPSSPSPCLWTQVLGGLSLHRKRRSCQITFAGGMSEVVKEVRGWNGWTKTVKEQFPRVLYESSVWTILE